MIGAPAEIENEINAEESPPGPPAPMVAEKFAIFEGVPLIVPVSLFMANPAGSVSDSQEVTGRSARSCMAGVLENATPTLPVSDWFGIKRGAPFDTEKVTSSVLDPLLELAVMDEENDPESSGVPVIAPVEVLRTKPGGRKLPEKAVAGRSAASVRASFPEKDTPTLAVNDWPAVKIGVPVAIENETVVPGGLAAEMKAEESWLVRLGKTTDPLLRWIKKNLCEEVIVEMLEIAGTEICSFRLQ